MKYYIIRCQVGHEIAATNSLRQHRVTSYYPSLSHFASVRHVNKPVECHTPILPGYVFIPIIPMNTIENLRKCRLHRSMIRNITSSRHDAYATIGSSELLEIEAMAIASAALVTGQEAPRRLVQHRKGGITTWTASDDPADLPWALGDTVRISDAGLFGTRITARTGIIKSISPLWVLVELPATEGNVRFRVRIGVGSVERCL